MSDACVLRQRTERRVRSLHGTSRQTNGALVEILFPRSCAHGCGGIFALFAGVRKDQRRRIPSADVGLHVPGSVKSHERGTGTGSSNFDHGRSGTVYRYFRSGLYDS